MYSRTYGWATDLVFVPAYDEGNAPFGVYPVYRVATTQSWQKGDIDHDAAMIIVHPADQKRVQDVVGGLGLEWGRTPASGYLVRAIGYPANPPYDGSTQRYCDGETFDDTRDTDEPYAIGLACDMGSGSSGGPWVTDSSSMGEVANGLTSYGYVAEPGTFYSPSFGSFVGELYQQTESIRPPSSQALISRDLDGYLWLYPRDGTTGWLPRQRIGSGWNSMTAIINGAT